MVYESTINFTLDTICPWTYLAKRRLDKALSRVEAENPPIHFVVHYNPYQLFADAPEKGEDKYEWYKRTRYQNSEDLMKKYTTVMSVYGVGEGIDFKFGGTIANTTNAHRVIQHFQEKRGPECADKLIDALYEAYFEKEQHPSSSQTLLAACKVAGIPDDEAKAFVEDEDEELMDVKMQIREQAGNGVDSVPYITIEGKRRDFTLIGAKEVDEYVKTLKDVIRESS